MKFKLRVIMLIFMVLSAVEFIACEEAPGMGAHEQWTGDTKDGKKEGEWRIISDNCIIRKIYYNLDTMHGFWCSFYPTERIKLFGLHDYGEMVGVWYELDDSGRIKWSHSFQDVRPRTMDQLENLPGFSDYEKARNESGATK
jgi:hypothetical protein